MTLISTDISSEGVVSLKERRDISVRLHGCMEEVSLIYRAVYDLRFFHSRRPLLSAVAAQFDGQFDLRHCGV